jgi:hypothetical protein
LREAAWVVGVGDVAAFLQSRDTGPVDVRAAAALLDEPRLRRAL